MKFRKNMKIGVSVIFLLLIFTTSISLIDFSEKNDTFDKNSLSISAPEDPYEPNDFYMMSGVITLDENIWLSSISGTGTQLNDDYYRIYVRYGYQHVRVNLTFIQTFGDIDLELCDYIGTPLFNSSSSTSNEFLDVFVPFEGEYYIRVFGDNSGNSYDLLWESYFTDDEYEENDDWTNATDISGPSHRFMSHRGIQGDNDVV